MSDLFEKASRLKLRFNTPQGLITVEDVWDLPLLPHTGRTKWANLDDLAKSLHRELKDNDTESFVLRRAEPNEELSLRFDIVKHIISVRLAEKDAAEIAEVSRQKKARILEIIADKEDEALKGQSLEDLRSLLNSL